MRSIILFTALTSACLPATPHAQPKPAEGAEVGRVVFLELCAPCHGEDARGSGPVARSLKKRPADLTRLTAMYGGRFPADEIAKHIDGRENVAAHGSREMPVWGDSLATSASEQEERDARVARAIGMLVEYLQTIQKEEAPASP